MPNGIFEILDQVKWIKNKLKKGDDDNIHNDADDGSKIIVKNKLHYNSVF